MWFLTNPIITRVNETKEEKIMFTQNEAKSYLDDLFENVFGLGQIERLSEFYTNDVIGHYNESTFGFNDIADRIILLNEICQKRRFVVKSFVVSGDVVIVKCRQTWLTNTDKKLCESMVVAVYHIRDKKIDEAWLLIDDARESYLEINQSDSDYLPRYELNSCSQKQFFDYMSDYEYFYQKDRVSLSEKEQETLFYYMRGLTAKEIANEMNVSHRTIESYISDIMDKYNCNSKIELRKKLFPDQ